MLVNYSIGRELAAYDDRKRTYSAKLLLWSGIGFNLGLLGYFKYMDFFIQNVNRVFHSEIALWNMALPLAISFYTFQQIAYLVDSYRKETKEYDFLNYAVFVTFFPQLIAGPIVHHAEMMPQFDEVRNKVKNYYNIALGLFIFSMGLFKKVVIADTFAIWATQGFDVAQQLNMLEAWITSLSYTFEFWRRWHITLSRFLKEYLYIPLGGNRKGELRTYTNLFTTFLLGGIWHGAGWTFVIWGALHGFALVIHRAWQKIGFKLPGLLGWFITFNFINIAWVFFRALNFESAIKVLKGMFLGDVILPASWVNYIESLKELGFQIGHWSKLYGQETYMGLWFSAIFIVILFFPNSMELKKKFKLNFFFMLLTVLFSLAIFMLYRKSEFIYFNF